MYQTYSTKMVRMTGFPPVAALAGKQSTGLFGPTDKSLCDFLPISNPSILINKKSTTTRAVLTVMTGL